MISNWGGEAAIASDEVLLQETVPVPPPIARIIDGKENQKARSRTQETSIDGTVEKEKQGERAKLEHDDPIEKIAAKLHRKFRIKPDASYRPHQRADRTIYRAGMQAEAEPLDYAKLFSYLDTKTATDVYQAQYTTDAKTQTADHESLTWQQFDEIVRKGIYNEKMGFMDHINPFDREKAELLGKILDVSMKMTRQMLAGTARIG